VIIVVGHVVLAVKVSVAVKITGSVIVIGPEDSKHCLALRTVTTYAVPALNPRNTLDLEST
jgi:hypothetical protein